MNNINKYKEIMKKVRFLQLKIVLEEKLTFQVCILSEIFFFSEEIVLLTAERPTLCVKRNPLSTVLTAVNTNAG